MKRGKFKMNDKSLKRWATALYVADYQRLFDNAPDFKFADLSETRQATYVLRARQLKAILAKTNLAGGDDDVSCAKAAVSRVAALEAEIAALRETLGKVRAWATSAATNDGAMMSIRESIHVASAGKEVLAILDGGK